MFNGWGASVENWRFQPEPGISAAELARLELKWAFGIPGVVTMFGQPTLAGGRVFIGGQNEHVYSLDVRTGCYFWDHAASAGVRTAITVARTGGRSLAFFGDRRGRAYAIDAATGETVWKVTADDDSAAQVTGSPVCSRADYTFRSQPAMTAPRLIRSMNVAKAEALLLRLMRVMDL